jgi:hypothetical protein
MRWVAAAAVFGLAVAGCGGTTKTVIQSAAPTRTVTRTVVKHPSARPAHTTTGAKTTNAPSSTAPSPQPATPAMTNGVAVVTQYYQDITDGNYSAAWALGGRNIAALNGQTYNSWVAGYGTTANINITSSGAWDANRVWCDISATQDSGAVYDYYGTYDVAGGVIVSAHVRQVG